jgi:GxxExxY protein
MSKEEEINKVTKQIIRAYYNVYNTLGHGFLEKVYENAMILELPKVGLHGKRQAKIVVRYEGEQVGLYFADIVVESLIIVEIKAAEALCAEHEAQLLNYLQATDMEYGLLLNFGAKPQMKRKVWTNQYHGKSEDNPG